MVAILSLSLVLQSTEVIKYWFESQVQSRYAVWIENGAFVIMAAVKVLMILQQASLMVFVWITAAETMLAAIGLLAIYNKCGGRLSAWQPRIVRIRTLIKDSWPLMLSGVAVITYMRIDQVMLGHMLGDDVVGIYSAALKISEVWYFVPMAIAASVFPALAKARASADGSYQLRLQAVFNLMTQLALTVALIGTLIGPWLINLLYGIHYAAAGSVLVINIWSGLFVALGVTAGKWVILEGHYKNALLRVVLGALINIGGNLLLIPSFGAVGAAWASLVSYAFANWLSLAMSASTMACFRMQTRAVIGFGLLR